MKLRQRWQAWWQARHPASDTHRLVQRNIYILPSRPGLFFCATLLVLLLASINDQLSLGYALTFLLAGAGFASMHATHGNLRGLSLDLKPPASVHAGQDLQLELRLHNNGRARYGIGLRVGTAGEPAWVDVPAGGHAQLSLACPAARRGLMSLPMLRIATRFPLGLFGAWSVWRPAARVWVYPRPEEDAPPLPAHAASSGDGSASAGLQRRGDDFESVRPYQHGDSPKQVLWKKAAQQGGEQLLVRDSLAPASRRRWLRLADTAGLQDWEARLSRLTAWALEAEQRGEPWGLSLDLNLDESQTLEPDLGPAHLQAALQMLAAAPGGVQP